MMRKIAIGLAAAAVAVGGSTLSASAHYGPMGSYESGKSHIPAHRFGHRTYGMEEREYGPRHGYYDREPERREFERHGYEPLLSRTERERLRSRIASRLEREPFLSRFEREQFRSRIASRLERGEPLFSRREPLLSQSERERLRGRIISRLEREPLLSPFERERLRGRIISRLKRERLEERGKYAPRLSQLERERYTYRHPMYGHGYERPYGYRYGYERPYGHRYGYEHPMGYRYGYEYERPYGYRYGYERPYGYRYGHERPYGYRYGHERPYGYRYGYEGHKHGPEYYGRR
jgi:hypothetical protein